MKTRLPLLLLMFIAITIGCVVVGEPGWRGFRYWIYNSRHNDGTSPLADRRDLPSIDIRRGVGFCRASVRVKDPRDVLLAACSGHPLRSLSFFDLFYHDPIEIGYRSSNLGTRDVSSLVRDIPFQEDATHFYMFYNADDALFPVCDVEYILRFNRGRMFSLLVSHDYSRPRVAHLTEDVLTTNGGSINAVDRDQRGEQVLTRWHQARQAANWQLSQEQEANYEAEFFQSFER